MKNSSHKTTIKQKWVSGKYLHILYRNEGETKTGQALIIHLKLKTCLYK